MKTCHVFSKKRLSLLLVWIGLRGFLAAEPFTLPGGEVIEVLEVRRVRGIVQWAKASYTKPARIPTPWGEVSVRDTIYFYPSGAVKSVRLGYGDAAVAELTTPYGKVTVKDEIGFHENGQIARLVLTKLYTVVTPVATVQTQHLTFHPTGELSSVSIPSWRPGLVKIKGSSFQVKDGLEFYTDGTVAELTFLSSNGEEIGIPQGKARVRSASFHENGSVKSVSFASDDTIVLGYRARSAGFYPDGSIQWLELTESVLMETPLGTRRVKGTVEWHPNGKFKDLTFEGELPVQDFPGVGRFKIKWVTFYAHGPIEEVILDKIEPIRTPAGTVESDSIAFHPNGVLKYAQLTKQDKEFSLRTPVGVLKAGWFVRFHDNGALFVLSFTPMTAHPVKTPLGTVLATNSVVFYPSGALAQVELSTSTPLPTPVGVLPLDLTVDFYETGQLKRCEIRPDPRKAWDDTIRIKTSVGSFFAWSLEFHPNGALRELTIAAPHPTLEPIIEGKRMGDFHRLQFAENEKYLGSLPPAVP
jgi:antitoxin component YwqK of YwqJK toxin-antitoxin module